MHCIPAHNPKQLTTTSPSTSSPPTSDSGISTEDDHSDQDGHNSQFDDGATTSKRVLLSENSNQEQRQLGTILVMSFFILICLCTIVLAFIRVVTMLVTYLGFTGNISSFGTTRKVKIARRIMQSIYSLLAMSLLRWFPNGTNKAIHRHSSTVEDRILFASLFLTWILHGIVLFGNILKHSATSSQDSIRVLVLVERCLHQSPILFNTLQF